MTIAKYKSYLSLNTKRLRLEKGLSQEKLALKAGIDRTLVSKIERGFGNPTLSVLIRIANALGVSVNDCISEKCHIGSPIDGSLLS